MAGFKVVEETSIRMADAPAEFVVGMKCMAWPPDGQTLKAAQDWFAGLPETSGDEFYTVTVTTVGDDGVMKVNVDEDPDLIEDRHWFDLYPIREKGTGAGFKVVGETSIRIRMADAPAEFVVGMKCMAWPPDGQTLKAAQDWFAGLPETSGDEFYTVTVTTVGDDGVMKVNVDEDPDLIEDRHWFDLYPIREKGTGEQQQQEQEEEPIQEQEQPRLEARATPSQMAEGGAKQEDPEVPGDIASLHQQQEQEEETIQEQQEQPIQKERLEARVAEGDAKQEDPEVPLDIASLHVLGNIFCQLPVVVRANQICINSQSRPSLFLQPINDIFQ